MRDRSAGRRVQREPRRPVRRAGAGAGTGLVRAKTGTLTGVHSLAGTGPDRSSATLLVFAVATDSAPPAKALGCPRRAGPDRRRPRRLSAAELAPRQPVRWCACWNMPQGRRMSTAKAIRG